MGQQIDTPGSHNPMTLQDVRDWLRWQAPSISRLVRLGEADAISVERSYRAWWARKEDPRLQNELITAVKNFMVKSMTITERTELGNRYGFKIDEK